MECFSIRAYVICESKDIGTKFLAHEQVTLEMVLMSL